MPLRVGDFNLSKGELAEELVARVDVGSYAAGAKRARNVLIQKYGGLTKRPGTRFVAEVHNAANPVRLFPFQFSLTQAYAMEMGQGYLRLAAFGGMVLESALTITAITKAANASVTCAYHGYAVGDEIYFSGVLGMVEINGRTGTVKTAATSSYTVDIDSSGFSTFTGDTGGTVNAAPPPPPPPPPPVVPPPVDTPPPTTSGGGAFGGDGGVVPLPPGYPSSGPGVGGDYNPLVNLV